MIMLPLGVGRLILGPLYHFEALFEQFPGMFFFFKTNDPRPSEKCFEVGSFWSRDQVRMPLGDVISRMSLVT